MTAMSQRLLGQGRNTAQELNDLLQWLWLAELLDPGEEICILAPMIDNAPVLDNSTGAFDALDPGWGRRPVRLLELLLRLAGSGQRVVLASVESGLHSGFVGDLRASAEDHGLDDLIKVYELPWISGGGLLTTHGLVRGELELAFDSIRLGGGSAVFDTDPRELAQARAAFRESLALAKP